MYMRYMGIDYGSKDVGISLSDESGTLAFPHAVLANTSSLVQDILKIVKDADVKVVVMGLSLNHRGEENPIMRDAHKLADALTLEKLVVRFEPEQLTTQEARRNQGDVQDLDASAAAIILNSYLARENMKQDPTS